jgi:hypothetical protein
MNCTINVWFLTLNTNLHWRFNTVQGRRVWYDVFFIIMWLCFWDQNYWLVGEYILTIKQYLLLKERNKRSPNAFFLTWFFLYYAHNQLRLPDLMAYSGVVCLGFICMISLSLILWCRNSFWLLLRMDSLSRFNHGSLATLDRSK